MYLLQSPASTHSLSSEIHWLMITRWSDWLQGSLWHQKHKRFHTCFWRLSLVHCCFKEKILSNAVDLWIYTWLVL